MDVRTAEIRMAEIAREDAAREALVDFARDVVSWADAACPGFPERLYQRAAAIVAAHASAGIPPAPLPAAPGEQTSRGRGRELPLPDPASAA